MWYVYFLQLSNGDIYVGSTNDLRRRVESHKQGHVNSTKAYLPIALNSYVAVQTERRARELEQYFKSGSGKAFAKKHFLTDPRRSIRSGWRVCCAASLAVVPSEWRLTTTVILESIR